MPEERRPGEGRRAFFSAADEDVEPESPLANHGPFVVTCSACKGVTRVALLDLAVYAWPVMLWRPARQFDRWLRCPSCGKRRWLSVAYRPED